MRASTRTLITALAVILAGTAAPLWGAKPAPVDSVPAITFVVDSTRDKVVVCNADGKSQVTVYTGAADRNLISPVMVTDLTDRDHIQGNVVFVEQWRTSAEWYHQLRRVRFEVTNGVLRVLGVETLAEGDMGSTIMSPVVFSADDQIVVHRGGFNACVPDRIERLTLGVPGVEEICRWPDWGPECTTWITCEAPGFPEWVIEALTGMTSDGGLLLLESNWKPFAPGQCPDPPPFVSRFTRIDLNDPVDPSTGYCATQAVHATTQEILRDSGETARKTPEIALAATVDGVDGLYRVSYVGVDLPPTVTVVPGTEGLQEIRLPSWSCDDSQIVFQFRQSRGRSIGVVAANGGTVKVIAASGAWPHWGCPVP